MLKEKGIFSEVYVFGSLTKPYQFNEYSDIDLAFQKLDKDQLFSVVGYLSRNLNREINAVCLEEVHFKEKILKEGIRWRSD